MKFYKVTISFKARRRRWALLLAMCTSVIGSARSLEAQTEDYISDSLRMTACIDSARVFFHSDHNRAYNMAQKALVRYEHSPYVYGKIRLLHLLAEINYYYRSAFDSSLTYLNRMRELSDSIGLERGEAWYNLNLANIYYYQNDYNKAMRLYNFSRAAAEDIRDSIIITDALTGIADILMQWGDYENSLKYLQHALTYALSRNSLMGQFLVYDDIANIYKLTERYDSSMVYYEKALDLGTRMGNIYAILVSRLNVVYLKYVIEPSLDIIPVLEELLAETRDLNFMRLYIDVGFTLCEVLQDRGNYREANVLYQEVFAIRDSVMGNEGIRQVAEMESNFELQKKELENRELMRLNELNSLKLKVRIIVIFIVIFFLIQILILLFINFRRYRTIKENLATIKEQEQKIFDQEKELLLKEKETIEFQLQSKEREYTRNAMKVFEFNQLNQKVIEELGAIRMMVNSDLDKEEVNQRIQSMINEMESSLNDHVWKEFETIFMESNPGYLKKLIKKFPGLTPNEIKLCVLLYLNLRTKEISAITKQSIKSINVARTRLRKKLQIEHTSSSISSYLKQIG